jgi:hypothetical protein
MNPAELAKYLAAEFLGSGSVWLFLILTAVFAGAGAYLGRYLGAKGANLATKEDFKSLQEQLKASTHLVESVKTEIARTDWVAREWATIRIKKIEQLMSLMHANDAYLDAMTTAGIEGKAYTETDLFQQTLSIAELYLPEIFDVVNRYIFSCRKMKAKYTGTLQEDLQSQRKNTPELWNRVFEDGEYERMLDHAKQVSTSAANLIRQIISEHQGISDVVAARS